MNLPRATLLLSVATNLPRATLLLSVAGMAATLGCAGPRDHFYSLSPLPPARPVPASGYATHVILSLSLPPVVDRRQMVIHMTGDQVAILEHERWASPLSELAAQTLARDIEQRRPEVLVADRSFDRSGTQAVRLRVDIVEMSARRGGEATLEAHWRIVGAQSDDIGGEVFSSPLNGKDYGAVAQAFSADLAALADRLAQKLPPH